MDSEQNPPDIRVTPSLISIGAKPEFVGIGFWNSYTRSSEYLDLQPENALISEDELSKHTSIDDMWIALRNNQQLEVYDVTPFAEFHPGGSKVIAQHAGTDASEAFRCAHAYISVNMISRLKKGVLVKSGRSLPGPNLLSPTMNVIPMPHLFKNQMMRKPTLSWTTKSDQSMATLKIALTKQLVSISPTDHALVTFTPDRQSIQGRILQVRVLLHREYSLHRIKLLPELEPDLRSIRIHPHSVGLVRDPCVCIDLRCSNNSSKMLSTLQNNILEHKILSLNDLCSPATSDYWNCVVTNSKRLGSSPYRCIRLKWPEENAYVPIPLLHHVFLRVKDPGGVSHVRPYTPTCTNFLREASSAVEFDLLIKVYENGIVSTILDKTKEGSTVEVSLPMGRIGPCVLLNCVGDEFRAWNRIYMLCAGSGVTPFLPVIRRIINLHQTSVRLLWFNRKPQDVILSQELENLASCAENRFAVHHWLETQPEDSVPSLSNSAIGRVGEAQCYKFFDHFDDVTAVSTLCLICGPPGFNTSAKELTEALKISENVHVI